MVMGRRPDVETASAPRTVYALGSAAFTIGRDVALAGLNAPWKGDADPATNTRRAFMRGALKGLLGYAATAPTPDLRSLEIVIDDICSLVLPGPTIRGKVNVGKIVEGGIDCLYVTPATETTGTMLYMHGGGYEATTPKMYTGLAARMAIATDCEIVIPDYRMAPEFPYPAALEDAAAVYQSLLKTRSPKSIVVGGDSGGGGLAAALLEDICIADKPVPSCAVLFSPEVDLSLSGETIRSNVADDILPANIPVDEYLDGVDPTDPLVSPLYADPSNFPPMFIVSGAKEMFLDEIERFVANARKANVEVDFYNAPDMFHVFEIILPRAQQTKMAIDELTEFVNGHLERRV